MGPLPSDNDGSTPRPPSPTDRALMLPEILSHIFLCALPDHNDDTTTTAQTAWDPTARRRGLAALAVCCRVSKLWHAEAAPRLWSRPCSARLNLDEVLARAGPGVRRGFHAGLVEEGALACGWGEELAGAEGVLGGVQFPRLRRVTVYLSTGWTRIPRLAGASVTRLDLVPTVWREEENPDDLSDPVDESYVLDQGPVLEQIPEIFPNLKVVEFQDQCLVSAKDLQRLRDRLPRLEYFNHDLVVDDVTDIWEAPYDTGPCSLPPLGVLAGMFGD